MTTFGFEAEFQTNANAVIAALHTLGLSGDNRLHGYHCDCDYCAFGNGFAFRGQTDSSCSGEIISDVFGIDSGGNSPYHDEPSFMQVLCDAAVEVDAEPGMNSGFHVHVGIQDNGTTEMRDALWQFILWEPVLHRIAGGRWATRRDGMNAAIRDQLRYVGENYGVTRNTTGGWLDAMTRTVERGDHYVDEFKQQLVYTLRDSDRHSNLNIQARTHPTWEFRIWNSTRSAWRMEMFCGLSVALLDPDVIEGLAELVPPRRMAQPSTGIESIALACANGGFDRVAELLERQAHYLNDRADSAPAVLTAL